ncbi:glycosyltransferase family 2 protein [Sphingobium nicotianae]|uniref:Glycosyltransferase n=1 Tax=Sphingobium nicotianae TaxID=2782607 RepID=A0A9X1DF52_9SPHN|nr:glycosyltransferase family 2 protein [Sphingobium nicotianae]MBT2189092.1 glycosyltransferase [Sphingobium nicotianae]
MCEPEAPPGSHEPERETCPPRGAGTPRAEDPPEAGSLEPVFTGRRKILNLTGLSLWLATLLYFWIWWLDPAHIYTPIRYGLVTAVLLWVTLLPAYFIFLFNNAKIPSPHAAPFAAARVAMVVTKAPSEPFHIVKKTLEGALVQPGFVHDTWLADEDPDAETLAWCGAHGVQVSSRKGIPSYHRPEWPRRTRCKEGNLAYFYDQYGYDRYDFVSQFDADHVPSPDYLRHALAPFADPDVGYVSAPSICDSNARESWSARGRLYLEASMHGALQTGYNAGFAPLCIGSHYTVRTAALRSIGGLGPELAEDHSTTLMMNAHGWKGVHAIDAIAHGAGPETFTDLIIQEFQWSRSLVTILLRNMPACLGKLPWRLRFQFLFSELWYPLFSSMGALMFLMPIIALVTRTPFVNVTYIAYFMHIAPLSLTTLGLAYWWRSTGLFRPPDAKILSWEGMAFLLLRWPWSLLGSLTALWDLATGSHVDFRITPKGVKHAEPVPFRVIAPYALVAILSADAAWLVNDAGEASGFYFFGILSATVNGILILAVLALHARENHCPIISLNRSGAASMLSLATIGTCTIGAAQVNGLGGIAAMNVGITAFTLTETLYTPAGAGQPRARVIRFHPRWHGLSHQDKPKTAAQREPESNDERKETGR